MADRPQDQNEDEGDNLENEDAHSRRDRERRERGERDARGAQAGQVQGGGEPQRGDRAGNAEDKDQAVELSDELARRWDPHRLSKLVATKAGKAEGLDIMTRGRYEKRLGVDLSRVKVVTGAFAEEFTAKHNAEAITVGSSGMILMRQSSQFSGPAQRESLLAHELTHVAQAAPGFHNKTSGAALGSSASEAEAESVERMVLAEEQGEDEDEDEDEGGGPDEGHNDEMRRERLVTLVMDLVEEDERVQAMRSGQAS